MVYIYITGIQTVLGVVAVAKCAHGYVIHVVSIVVKYVILMVLVGINVEVESQHSVVIVNVCNFI